MSSSSGELGSLSLSIVIGSNGAPASVESCLAALEPQVDGAEVLVCEPEASAPEVRERFPFARFLERRGALVPALWRDGIDASRGRFVALTVSPMRPAEDWVERIIDQLERVDVVAGAVEPGERLRRCDWAEYFCRYSHDALPFEGHECVEQLPGDNAGYRRESLESTRDLFRDGFVEPFVNRRLADAGATLRHEPSVVVYQGRSAGTAAFVRQRLAHGRDYGWRQGRAASAARNLASAGAAPLVPLVLTTRLTRGLLPSRRFRRPLLTSLPLVLTFNAAWAAGEAAGRLDALRGR
jgi:hypothetical protein